MRKFVNYFVIALAFVFAGCNSQEGPFNPEEPTPDEPQIHGDPERVFLAVMETGEDPETKTYMDEYNNVYWSDKDEIGVFENFGGEASRFVLESVDPLTNTGKFKVVSSPASPQENLDGHNFAFYPYSENKNATCASVPDSVDCYRISNINIPTFQTYVEGTFANGDAPMVALSRNNELQFKNLCGLVKLQLTGDKKIKRIKMIGNNQEPISGAAAAELYTADARSPKLIMSSNPTEVADSIVLDCGAGVQLDPNIPKTFIFCVPPTVFSNGFAFVITDTEGKSMAKAARSSKTIFRSRSLKMKDFPYQSQLKIKYTTIGDPDTRLGLTVDSNGDFWKKAFDDFLGNNKGQVYLPNSQTSIPAKAFQACAMIKSVEIPEGVDSIGNSAFNAVQTIEKIVIPKSVKWIGIEAFMGCSAISRIVLPEGLTEISGGLFTYCANLTTVNIPSSVTYIGGYAFSGTSIETVDFPQNLTEIRQFAFSNCKELTAIEIPSKVATIGDNAFKFCKRLTNVKLLSENPPELGVEAFYNKIGFDEAGNDISGILKDLKIHVPAASVQAYKEHPGWSVYADHISE